MANRFILWAENGTNIQSYTEFLNDDQRQAGFQSGTPASSSRVNTALRQANLVSAALMNALMPSDNTLDFTKDLETVTNAINTSLNTRITNTVVNNSANAENATNATNVVTDGNDKRQLTLNSDNTLTINSNQQYASDVNVVTYHDHDVNKVVASNAGFVTLALNVHTKADIFISFIDSDSSHQDYAYVFTVYNHLNDTSAEKCLSLFPVYLSGLNTNTSLIVNLVATATSVSISNLPSNYTATVTKVRNYY